MDYSDKIKAIQKLAGVEADGFASSKTWIAIYHLLYASVPYDLNMVSIVKAIQQKIEARITGQVTPRTWDALYSYLKANQITPKTDPIELHNEIIFQSMTKEVVPFAKELIQLASEQGIYMKLMCNAPIDPTDLPPYKKNNLLADSQHQDFGLVFDIGIYLKTPNGDYLYQKDSPLYAVVAKLGESIGLTWAGEKKMFTSQKLFELRPAWAIRMKYVEMIEELGRRKKENINLLAFL